MSSRKGISEVISTLLIIMLTIVAVYILAAFLIPFLKDKMKQKECFDAMDKLTIEEGKYTCYNSTNTLVMVKLAGGFEIGGFVIALSKNGESKRYEIKNGASFPGNVTMYDGSVTLGIPGAARLSNTYIFNGVDDFIEVMPILPDGRTCSSVTAKLNQC
jgi:flagellin-like protein